GAEAAAEVQLAAGAGAVGEAGDGVELGGAAELLGVGAAGDEEVAEELAGGDAGVEVVGDQLGVHAVAGGEEAVLVEDLGWDAIVVGGRSLLDLEADDRLHQRR